MNTGRNRLTIAAVAATAATFLYARMLSARPASRLPQSRRLRLVVVSSIFRCPLPPHDCRSRGDCGCRGWTLGCPTHVPPHDCRSRGDCGRGASSQNGPQKTASRLPQSRRLRLEFFCRDCGERHPASRLPQSRRLRPDRCYRFMIIPTRLTIAAVAATAACSMRQP